MNSWISNKNKDINEGKGNCIYWFEMVGWKSNRAYFKLDKLNITNNFIQQFQPNVYNECRKFFDRKQSKPNKHKKDNIRSI